MNNNKINDSTPLGSINLYNVYGIETDIHNDNLTFNLRTLNRKWILKTDKKDVYEMWLNILKNIIYPNIVKEGYIQKKGEKKMDKYRKRYFILTNGIKNNDINMNIFSELRYYETKNKKKFKGVIYLNNVIKMNINSYGNGNKLDLITKNRTYHLDCQTNQDRTEWYNYIRNIINGNQYNRNSQSTDENKTDNKQNDTNNDDSNTEDLLSMSFDVNKNNDDNKDDLIYDSIVKQRAYTEDFSNSNNDTNPFNNDNDSSTTDKPIKIVPFNDNNDVNDDDGLELGSNISHRNGNSNDTNNGNTNPFKTDMNSNNENKSNIDIKKEWKSFNTQKNNDPINDKFLRKDYDDLEYSLLDDNRHIKRYDNCGSCQCIVL